MCERPNVIKGYEVSCRNCGQCLATYVNTWVARCVAQKLTSEYAYCITLTYADIDGKPPLGAKVFRYKDVSDFWKRLRFHANKQHKQHVDIRYVVVGEKGTRFGRCHYHAVVFSSHDLAGVGDYVNPVGGGFTLKRRLNWSIWGHGFVEFQQADRDGMAYVLKYVMKGKMNAKKSRGQRREGKTEWIATSYLWCSKVPSIGASWLWQKLKRECDRGLCPSNLRILVPSGGDWYVHGRLQREMCLYLRDRNLQYRAERGRDLAGWKTLIASVADEIELEETGEVVRRKPWEWLNNGEEQEKQVEADKRGAERQFAKFNREYAERRRTGAKLRNARAIVEKCGNVGPCETCARGLSGSQRADAEQEYRLLRDEWAVRSLPERGQSYEEFLEGFPKFWYTRLKPSRWCELRHDAAVIEAFRSLVPIEKATHGNRYKKAIGKAL